MRRDGDLVNRSDVHELGRSCGPSIGRLQDEYSLRLAWQVIDDHHIWLKELLGPEVELMLLI